MKWLAGVAVALLTLTACGSEGPANNDPNVAQIQTCVEQGGHPIYTNDQNGNAYFIACEPKPKP